MKGNSRLVSIILSALFLALACLLMVTLLQAQAPEARRVGEEVLYEALLGARDFLIVVPSNGCIRKESFPDGSIHYIFFNHTVLFSRL